MVVYCLLLSFLLGASLLQAQTAVSQALLPVNLKSTIRTVIRPIRIALSVDEQSFKDFLIVMSSVLSSADNPNRLVFHIVSCAKDLETARTLQLQITDAIESCFPRSVKFYSTAFTLPPNSGFDSQLKAGNFLHNYEGQYSYVKSLVLSNTTLCPPCFFVSSFDFFGISNKAKRVSHWVSSSGADMVRFFLPSLFPNVKKLLYLDNDVIVSCCVEEVWNTKMTENQIVGEF